MVAGLAAGRPRRRWLNNRPRRSHPPSRLRPRSCARLSLPKSRTIPRAIHRPIRPSLSTQLPHMQRTRILDRRPKLPRSWAGQSPGRSKFGRLGFDEREALAPDSGRCLVPASTFASACLSIPSTPCSVNFQSIHHHRRPALPRHSPRYRTTTLPCGPSHSATTCCWGSRICPGIHTRNNPSAASWYLE